jgi:hypothetical protein
MKIVFSLLSWFLALLGPVSAAENSLPGVKSWPLKVPAGGRPGFTLMPAADTGINFTNELVPEAEFANNNLLNGSGLALGDYDGDGWCDIFLCNLSGRSRLYRNLGNWKFQDVTAAAGLALTNALARGATFADVNGDGYLDLLVTYSGKGAKLFLNNGKGQFQDAQATELAEPTGSMTLALGDMNGDGYFGFVRRQLWREHDPQRNESRDANDWRQRTGRRPKPQSAQDCGWETGRIR